LSYYPVKEFLVPFLAYSRLASLFTTQSWAVTSVSGNSLLHLNTSYTLLTQLHNSWSPP